MNEKLKILKMIEDGHITATEAAQLLQAVEAGGTGYTPPPVPPPPPPPRSTEKKYDGYTANNGKTTTGSTTQSSIEDIGQKIETFAREAAPKVEKFMEAAASQIAGLAGRVSDAIVQPSTPKPPPKPTAPTGSQDFRPVKPTAPKSSANITEKQVEIPVETGSYNELNLSGLNGDIRIKGYNGDKITARITSRSKKPNAYIEFVKLGGKYVLKYESDDFAMVSIDAYVPERAFGVIKVDGMNGTLDASSLSANEMRFSNANGNTSLSSLAAANLYAESSNGRFTVSNIAAENATIENLNAPLETDELDISKLKISNYNSPLSIIISQFARYSEYAWNVETGNAKLSINLPTAVSLGYHIKAHAAMGEIRLGLTGLQYLINDPSLVEARSTNFDSSAKKVKLTVETSNAPLLIN